MTIKLNIDRESLCKLFEENPQFELELAASVTNYIIERFYEKNAKRIVAAADPELFAKALHSAQTDADIMGYIDAALQERLLTRDPSYWGRFKVKPETAAALQKVIEDKKAAVLSDASFQIEQTYGELIKAAVAKRFDAINIDELIMKRTEFLTTQLVSKMVDEQFEKRMADFKAMFK